MFVVVRCLLLAFFVARCSSCVVPCLWLFAGRRCSSLFAGGCVLFVVRGCLLSALCRMRCIDVCWLLRVVVRCCCLLCGASCVAVRCVLLAACRVLLFVVRCVMSVICCCLLVVVGRCVMLLVDVLVVVVC